MPITGLKPHASRLTASASRFIKTARVAHLATADRNGRPHVVPICFVFDGREFFSPIDEKPKRAAPRELKRLRNIRENPQVSLVIDHYEEDWTRLAYVLISGKGRVLQSGAKHQGAVKLLRKKYSQYRKMAIDERPMIVVTPHRITIWGTF